ncbi:triple tyrosine motif-containing protein, partial [Persicitalea sp.]|uniref:triple tyrosine motif-containing protein n=1 Tax=Persicitalea sp. TaxID=3100273 RepID=UPI0035944D00
MQLSTAMKNYAYQLSLPLVAAVFCLYPAIAQELPPISNYSQATYRAHSQNWDISQSADRIMYFANSDGLLEYDGASWRLFPLPNDQIVRAVLYDDDQTAGKRPRVYVGGFGEFGFWERSPASKMVYHSLSKSSSIKSVETEEIWHILKTEEAVYFQSFSRLYKYDGQDISEIKAPGNFMFLRQIQGRLLIQLIRRGLYQLQGDAFVSVAGMKYLDGASVSALLPFEKHKTLIATKKNGLFVLDDDEIVPWPIAISGELKKNILNRAIRLQNGNYAFGTILDGVYLVSAEGNLLLHFNARNGLQNNTVLSLFEDARQNLWLGLDKGIDMISLASPVTSLTQTTNSLGATYAAAVWDGSLYVGSNSGLYVKPWPSDRPFRLVPGLQGQVWDLEVIDGQLLCGHNDGTFRISERGVEKISSIPGGWTFVPLAKEGRKYLLQGTYTGLHLYCATAKGLWEYAHKVEGVPPIPIKGLVEGKDGSFWVAHAYKGLFRTKLNADFTKASLWQEYDAPEQIPLEYSIEVIPWKNRVLIRSGNRFFTPNDQHRLVADNEFGPTNEDPFKIRMGLEGEWFKLYRDRIILNKPNGQSRSFDLSPVRNSETIVPITPRHYLFCLGNGYALFDRSRAAQPGLVNIAPLIRKISSLTNSSITFPTDSNLIVPPETRSLRVNFSLPVYGSEVRYQYRLLGLSQRWSDWTTESYADFTNLSAGAYEFQVKTFSNKLITKHRFEVLPFWYETNWAKTLFAICAVILLVCLVFLQERQFAVRRRKIVAEQQEKLKQQELAAERQIIEIRNESLLKEITNKSQQLSNIAINVVRKNEILEDIR